MTESVWQVLSAIDCSAHIEKKGKFDYLAWTWAWAMVKENYPSAQYKILKDKYFHGSDTMEVRVEVTIEDLSHTMWLPVLDFNNKAIANPNAFDINSSRMRCLVKCLAMFGLGHYIFAGESLPAPSPELTDKYEEMLGLVAQDKHWELRKFTEENQPHMDSLFNLAPEGKKTQFKNDVRACYNKSNTELKASLAALEDAVGNPDTDYSVTEIFAEMEDVERVYTERGLNEVLRVQVNEKLEKGE